LACLGSAHSAILAVRNNGRVGIGTTGPGYKLHVVGGNVKIGNSVGDNRKLYFGDGSYVWIGEQSDDHLRLHSTSLSIEIGGDLGSSGEVLKSNGSTVYWGTDATGGGSSQWTDAGSYLYPNEYSGHRIYESGSYFTYYSGDPNSKYGHYFYNSDNRNGSNYYDQRTAFNGTHYWGNQYSAAVFGRSFLDYDRSSGTFGRDWSGDDWGALGYQRSGGSEYGGYFSGGYTGGSGRRRLGKSFGGADAGMDGKAHIDGGIAAYGDLFGADIHGVIYGTFTEGGRYASYDHGDRYIDGLDVHLTDVGEENMAVAFTNVSPKPVITAAGVGSLEGGRCKVVFDSGFSKQIASGGRIIVTATPLSDCRGIHIENISNEGFTVAENGGGTSDLEFTWIA